MSRRYGRNQKRRHRAEIASAQSMIASLANSRAMDQGLLQYQSWKISDLRAQLCAIAQEVGHQSALVGVESFLAGGFDGIRMTPAPLLLAKPITGVPSAYEKLTYEVLRLLNMEAVRDRMSGHLHFHVELAGKGVTYGISESAIRDLTPEFLERRIAPEIAKLLVRYLKGGA